ncbi:MAG TPA: adenylate/guanylate cyclase domain-containing protein [Terrimicrobiaceae bacterium]
MDTPLNSLSEARRTKYALLVTALAPVLPQMLGRAFNIWYNLVVIDPLLTTAALKERFVQTVVAYNIICYPAGVFLWLRLLYSLRPVLEMLQRGEQIPEPLLQLARRRVIRLPFIAAIICGAGWLLCIPVFILSLAVVNHGLDSQFWWHLPISFGVSGFISLTHGFFLVELASNWGLFPALFCQTRADLVPGAMALSLRGRGLLWVISAGICPIGSLLLLNFSPPAPGTNSEWLAVFVGSVGIAFGLCTALMVGRLFLEPIDSLRSAAQAVARGRLDVEVPLIRADEFGVLIGEFNHMIAELREKERLRHTFGLHVGRRAAQQILARDPGLGGVEQVITVMFADIRSFTAMSAAIKPSELVKMLNKFFGVMVQVVEERHGGMVNKFLGDGFLALFGVGGTAVAHADSALAAGRDMLNSLAQINRELAVDHEGPLAMGIGIHTGPAIVGSIGSPDRLEYTAIGSTVNFASRIEALNKVLGTQLLLTEATRSRLKTEFTLKEFPRQRIRGVGSPVKVFSIGDANARLQTG